MKKIPSTKKPIKKAPKSEPLWLIGIDEVGRGPVAGPVTMCAFGIKVDRFGGISKKSDSIFRKLIENKYLNIKINDSKKIKQKDREVIDNILRKETKDIYKFLIKSKSAKDIDKIGIAVCIRKIIESLLKDFIKSLDIKEADVFVLLDGGLKAPFQFINQETHIKGDAKFAVISCASILAKAYRDEYMRSLSKKDKGLAKYGFEIHKGYGTKKHLESIKKNGLSLHHRKTFLKKYVK
jgi:ribonuclease HII